VLVLKLLLLASICSLAQPPLIEYGRGKDLVNMFECSVGRIDVEIEKLNVILSSSPTEAELIKQTLIVEKEHSLLLAVQEDAKLFSSMLRARTNGLYRSRTISRAIHQENLELATSLERISARQFSHVEQKIFKAADKVRRLCKKPPVRTRSARSGFSLFQGFWQYG